MIQLFEQIYANANRIYYHCSREPNLILKSSEEVQSRNDSDGGFKKAFYITTNKHLANRFATKCGWTLYTLKAIRKLQIWNASNATDRMAFNKFTNYEFEDKVNEIVNSHRWEVVENKYFAIQIKDMGYDGFSTSEYNVRNIGVFEPSECLRIIKKEDNDKAFDENKNLPYQLKRTGQLSRKDWQKDLNNYPISY